jgi:hypothetical protein
MRFLALLLGLGLALAALTSCGGGDEESTPATTAEAVTPVHAGETPVAAAETPVATADSKYDEDWAREQIEPVLKEVYEIMLAQEWNKLYDLFSSDARAGCSRTTYVSKMAGLWLMSSAFGGEEILKAALQDLKEGNMTITFSEITKDRITYQAGDGEEPSTVVREDGKWKSTQPLGEDCASLDMDGEEGTTTPETRESATAESEELRHVSLGEQITFDAQSLPELAGEEDLSGQVSVTFERVFVATSYNDDICGQGMTYAKGKFVAVSYRVKNDAQTKMQPSSQLGDNFLLVDGRGRQWEGAESGSDYCFIDANFAEGFGGEGPEDWIGPGFEGLTAVVFDVPNDAEQLTLQNRSLGFKVDLGR